MIDMILDWSSGAGFQFLLVLMIASSLVILISLIVTHSMRRSSAACRFCIWRATFVALLMIPIGIVLLPDVPLGLLKHTQTTVSQNNLRQTSGPSIEVSAVKGSSSVTEHQPLPTNLMKLQLASSSATIASTDQDTAFSEYRTGQQDVNLRLSADEENREAFAFSAFETLRMLPWKPAIVLAWMAGVFLGLFRVTRSFFLATGVASRATEPSTQMKEIIERFDLPANVPIKLTNELLVPVALGISRSQILLPICAARWSSDRLRMVLIHELAHVQRRDVAWQFVAAITKSLVWFQPLFWFSEASMRLERERACDDQVIHHGELPSDYAAVLLKFAAEQRGLQCTLLGMMSVAEKPIEKRLKTILQPQVDRRDAHRWLQVAAFSSLVTVAVISGSIRPFAPIVLSGATEFGLEMEQDTPETKKILEASRVVLPDVVNGKVVDHEGNPIADAVIDFTIYSSENGKRPTFAGERYELARAKTDTKGKYRLETAGIKVNPAHFSFWGFVHADGYPEYRMAYSVKNYSGNEQDAGDKIKIHDAVMKPGRKISGRFVAPAGKREPPRNVVVRLMGDAQGSKYFPKWSSPTIKCDNDGRFETVVPEIGRVELTVTAENYAGVQIPVSPHAVDLGDIKLKEGVSVSGRVLDENGNPVVGTVVTISGEEYYELPKLHKNGMFSPIASSDKTDSMGRFQLPPHAGENRISVGKQGQRRDDDVFLAADVPLPVIAPRLVDLSDKPGQFEVLLQTGPTSKVSGSILWDDGSPAVDVMIKANVMSGGSGVVVDEFYTDEQGRYQLRFPKGVAHAHASLKTFGGRRADGVYGNAHPKITDPVMKQLVIHERTQSVQFTNVDDDIEGIDWELKPRENKNDEITRPVFRLLANESMLALKEIDARLGKAQNAAPLIQELENLEEKYRGEFAAVIALRQITRNRVSKPAALRIIQKHYLAHPDVDVILDIVAEQLYDSAAVALFKEIIAESPHDHVKATATYQLCIHLGQQLRYLQRLKQTDWQIMVPDGNGDSQPVDIRAVADYELDGQTKTYFQHLHNVFVNLDEDSLRRKILELSSQIGNEFSEIKRTQLLGYVGQNFPMERYRPADSETYADRVKPIVFELERLQVGQVVPEIEGIDGLGNPFRLSSLRGKTVVLFFGRAALPDSLESYSILKSQLADEPFEIVGVMKDSEQSVVRKAIDDGTIVWQTIWDGESWDLRPGSISRAWNTREADVFLIDKDGVIRHRMYDIPKAGDKRLEQRVKLLIRKSKS